MIAGERASYGTSLHSNMPIVMAPGRLLAPIKTAMVEPLHPYVGLSSVAVNSGNTGTRLLLYPPPMCMHNVWLYKQHCARQNSVYVSSGLGIVCTVVPINEEGAHHAQPKLSPTEHQLRGNALAGNYAAQKDHERIQNSMQMPLGQTKERPWEPNVNNIPENKSARFLPSKETRSSENSKHHREERKALINQQPIHRAPWEQGASRSLQASKLQRQFIHRELPQKMGLESEECGGYSGHGTERSDFEGKGEKSAMASIVEKLRKIESRNSQSQQSRNPRQETFSRHTEPVVVDSDDSGSDLELDDDLDLDSKFPWEREAEESMIMEDRQQDTGQKASSKDREKAWQVKTPSLAELSLPESELKRLRMLSLAVTQRIKVGKAGITQAVIQSIHEQWQHCEVARLKFEGPHAVNMRRTHEILERKTGGMVIWRSGGAAVVYRGKDYFSGSKSRPVDDRKDVFGTISNEGNQSTLKESPRVKTDLDIMYLREVEDILKDLGPRFKDWDGSDPVPVDADLLPTSNSFKPPFRQLPYKVRGQLSNVELTVLRKLARPLPPHFVLGRNRGLQGLAAAIVKLWEKSEIVKIGVKKGVQNTRNAIMAEELKHLTGGVLLSRDKFYITMYRGKDFLPPSVAAALKEREQLTRQLQEEEEKTRMLTGVSVVQCGEVRASTAGTLSEVLEAQAKWEQQKSSEQLLKSQNEAVKMTKSLEKRRLERKLQVAMGKKARAEAELAKVENSMKVAHPTTDQETITDEEKYMYRKLGLKMHAFLLVGRRGVFDGVVENMHLHWKHRELVKIILKEKDKNVAEEVARMLEAESGGILIAVITVSKGQAIIMYRGKNYQRPPELRPRNLLTKRKALKRSIELQRKQALEAHIHRVEKEIKALELEIGKTPHENSLPSATQTQLGRNCSLDELDDEADDDNGDILDDVLEASDIESDDELFDVVVEEGESDTDLDEDVVEEGESDNDLDDSEMEPIGRL